MNDFKNQMQEVIKRGNQQLNNNQYGNHQLQNNINGDVKILVDQVFKQLASIFPAWQQAWKTQQAIDTAKKEWVKAFIENDVNTVDQLRHGFKKARASDSVFLPSVGKFIKWCKPSLEDFGIDDPQILAKKVINYHHSSRGFGDEPRRTDGYDPFVVAVYRSLDWFSFSQMTEEKAALKVERVALSLLKNGYNPSKIQTMEQAPRIEKQESEEVKKSSPEVAAAKMAEIRAKLSGGSK